MSLIDIVNLTFCYDGSPDPVFEGLSVRLDTGWRLGLVGRNGRGKTTLLKLLMGEHEYNGTIAAGGVRFSYFPLEPEDRSLPALEAAERVAEAPLWAVKRELSLLQVPEEALSRPFDTLSGGERTKVLLAALFLREGCFPLIDEPTNHLDVRGRELVSGYLRGKEGFLLVSHDRAFLDSCTDHILALNKTGPELRRGNFSDWYRDKELRDRYEQNENERLKKDIRRLQDAARRTSDWSDKVEKTKYGTPVAGLRPDRGYIGHRAAKMMKRSKAIEARREASAEEKAGLLKDIEQADALRLRPLEYGSDKLLSLRGVSLSYGEREVCRDVSFTLCRNERLALQGRNGSGKSSLLKLVCGEDIPRKGEFRRGGSLIVSYVPQDASFLSGSLSAFARARELDETRLKTILRKLDFSRAQFEKDMGDYSAGQKKKVLLAASLCESAHLYVWDEPLNFIDVFSRMQIEALLRDCPPTLLFVEHDAAFTDAVATRKIEL